MDLFEHGFGMLTHAAMNHAEGYSQTQEYILKSIIKLSKGILLLDSLCLSYEKP